MPPQPRDHSHSETLRCRNCQAPDHIYYECPLLICSLCKQPGHNVTTCPRRGSSLCLHCSSNSHSSHECPVLQTQVMKSDLDGLLKMDFKEILKDPSEFFKKFDALTENFPSNMKIKKLKSLVHSPVIENLIVQVQNLSSFTGWNPEMYTTFKKRVHTEIWGDNYVNTLERKLHNMK